MEYLLRGLQLTGLICLCFSLAACSYSQNSNRQAICKEMKSQQILSPPNNDPSKVWQDRAGDDRLTQDYRANCS